MNRRMFEVRETKAGKSCTMTLDGYNTLWVHPCGNTLYLTIYNTDGNIKEVRLDHGSQEKVSVNNYEEKFED